jgi:hypothetical protein
MIPKATGNLAACMTIFPVLLSNIPEQGRTAIR